MLCYELLRPERYSQEKYWRVTRRQRRNVTNNSCQK